MHIIVRLNPIEMKRFTSLTNLIVLITNLLIYSQKKFFTDEIDNVAHNNVKIDVRCAFYFAAQHHQGFRKLAHEHQKNLERQSQILSATPARRNPTTGLS